MLKSDSSVPTDFRAQSPRQRQAMNRQVFHTPGPRPPQDPRTASSGATLARRKHIALVVLHPAFRGRPGYFWDVTLAGVDRYRALTVANPDHRRHH